jgi:hypothetical protein
MSALAATVAKFLAERDQVITAINNCPASNMEDYWRWQGNAEARRVLKQDIARDGIDLAADAYTVEAIEAQALRNAAAVWREVARNSRTRDGAAEATEIADWLDERADLIDLRRLEGAHP